LKPVFIIAIVVVASIGVMVPSVFAEDVPDWVKNIAGWWAEDTISEKEFVNAVGFLINEGIIQIQATTNFEKSETVPDWVKNTAGWWAEDTISEKEFVNAVGFLINEIVITNEHEGMCDESIDKNRNGIPDEFEEVNRYSGIIRNIDFSYCIFPNNISNYEFRESNLSYVDFTNIELKNVMFLVTTIHQSNFSNSNLYGVIFAGSSIKDSDFTNSDFYPNPWKNPYMIFNLNEDKISLTCYFAPCGVKAYAENFEYENGGIISQNNEQVLNFRLADQINDESDRRDIYRHVSGFFSSQLINSTFKNVDLSYAVFHNMDLSNAVIESSNTSNLMFDDILVYNTKINEKVFKERSKLDVIMLEDNNWKQMIYDKVNEKTQINDYKIDVNLIHVMDDIPINWSMGMTIFEQSLYVADTDNHRISVYDLDTLKKKSQFTSPISHYCESTHNWAPSNPNCPDTMRNLPTSIALLNEKIFVSYGFQDDIQIFDLNGKFLSKFGNSGNQKGEFSRPMHISASNDLLYIADSGNKRIQVVDSEGQFVKEFSVPISNESDLEISLDISENKIYVINNKNADVLIYDLNGNLIKKIILGQDIGNSSIGVENDLIVISNINKNTITIFDLDGKIMSKFGSQGEYYGEFNNPRGITVNDGKIYVSDSSNYRIQVFSMELK